MIKFFKSRCYNGGSQHKFMPRYSQVRNKDGFSGKAVSLKALKLLLYTDVYEKDVCVWCGKEIKK